MEKVVFSGIHREVGNHCRWCFMRICLQDALDSPTIVVITDRNDLDDQLYGQFAKCRRFLRQDAVQADKRKLSDQDRETKCTSAKRRETYNWFDGLAEWKKGKWYHLYNYAEV